MIVKIADNITSPLGYNASDNFQALLENHSKLSLYEGKWGIPEPFVASLFADGEIDDIFADIFADSRGAASSRYTRFEKICIASASRALRQCELDASSSRVLFIISTTKGNVELLQGNYYKVPDDRVYLGVAAREISRYFNNPNTPIVVSNACTSGACAQLVAKRCLDSGKYDYAVVIGADLQSKFIVTGFQSFKALSPEHCRPFDKNRIGLNLGDAAATIVFQRKDCVESREWVIMNGAIRNDANHISGPSRTGEGSYNCLRYIMEGEDAGKLALINVHGTATPYNDEMESIAIDRACLAKVPVNGLKGYYGHTMGAAGLLESIISQVSIEHGVILGTRGFKELGVSRNISVSDEALSTDKRSFIKLLSGFGGCNVALLYKMGGEL